MAVSSDLVVTHDVPKQAVIECAERLGVVLVAETVGSLVPPVPRSTH